jgi:hypothetical protein
LDQFDDWEDEAQADAFEDRRNDPEQDNSRRESRIILRDVAKGAELLASGDRFGI